MIGCMKRISAAWSRCRLVVLCTALMPLGVTATTPPPPLDPLMQLFQERGGLVDVPTPAPAPRPSNTGLVLHAMAHIGLPYTWGGTTFQEGFDCSAFVQAAFRHSVGVALPRTTAEQARATQPIAAKALQPGDLVFFNTLGPRYSHVGIYIGDGRFVHSPRSGAHIRIERLQVSYWQRRFTGARRVINDERASMSALPTTGTF